MFYDSLKESIVQLFARTSYPDNVNISGADIVEFTLLKASKNGVSIMLQNKLNGNTDMRTLEAEIRASNIHPDFFRYVKILTLKEDD